MNHTTLHSNEKDIRLPNEMTELQARLTESLDTSEDARLLLGFCDQIVTTYQVYRFREGKWESADLLQDSREVMDDVRSMYDSGDRQWTAFGLKVDKEAKTDVRFFNDLNPLLECSQALVWVAHTYYEIEPDSDYDRKLLEKAVKGEKFKQTLLYACYRNDLELVKERLQGIGEKALNQKMSGYGTALHLAVKHRNLDMAGLLLQAGADFSVKHAKMTPLELAYQTDNEDMITCLSQADPEGNRSLVEAKGLFLVTRSNNRELIESIVHRGADIHAIDSKTSRLTPLHFMAYYEKTAGIQTLADHGVNLEAKEQYGRTPLHYACQFQKLAGAKALLECGADPDPVNKDGETPLYEAAQHGNLEMVKLLCEFGADPKLPSGRTGKGATPLQKAEANGQLEIVAYFAKK